MPRRRPELTRDILEIDWPFFGELCRALALHVARTYDPEIVVGIAKAGVIPAAIIASILQRELVTMSIARPGDTGAPELITPPPPSIRVAASCWSTRPAIPVTRSRWRCRR